jgi:catechol 2,3-dioxygenase-like lactoylglutathione lyase family enzyme
MSLLQTQALSHMVIQASDITRSMEFYQRVFGYRVTMDLRDQPANRVIGGLVMPILKARDPAPAEPVQILAGPPGYGQHHAFARHNGAHDAAAAAALANGLTHEFLKRELRAEEAGSRDNGH